MAGPTPRRFMLIAPARSGSTMLSERLHSHAQITCFGEVLNSQGSIFHPFQTPRELDGILSSEIDPGDFLDTEVWPRAPEGARAVGFKILEVEFMHIHDRMAAYLDANPDIRAIFLRREQLLERYVSTLLAMQNKVWLLGDPAQRPKRDSAVVDPEDLARHFKTEGLQALAIRRRFEDRPVHDVTYEALLADPDGEGNRLCGFLGVEESPLRHVSVQMRTRSLVERIENYDEVKRAFVGTPFARYFP